MPETMKWLETSKSKIVKQETGGNEPHLEVSKVLLIHNIVNNNYLQHSRV